MNFQSLLPSERSGRTLLPALLVSALLHALLLWPAPRLSGNRQAAPAPLAATLRAAAVMATPERRVTAPVAAVKKTKVSSARTAVQAASRPVSSVEGAIGAPSPAVSGEDGTTVPSSLTPAAPLAGESGAPAAGLDADGLRAYRIGLAREARNHRRYPPLARERGWNGTAEVSVEVSAAGRPRRIELAHSSGHEVLDRAALAMVTHAAAAARLPDSLRGRAFAVSLPVVFQVMED